MKIRRSRLINELRCECFLRHGLVIISGMAILIGLGWPMITIIGFCTGPVIMNDSGAIVRHLYQSIDHDRSVLMIILAGVRIIVTHQSVRA